MKINIDIMQKTALFILLLICTSLFSQEILLKYPDGQTPYKGGYVQFYKDFNKILTEKNLKPCENKNEYYHFGILINKDNTINFVAENENFDEKYSKCTKELSREVAKHLKGWNAATQNGVNVRAVSYFLIMPDQLFGVLKENYGEEKDWKETMAEFPGGINEFRKKVVNNIDLSRFNYDKGFRLEVTFVVERDGSVLDAKLSQSSGLKQFDDMILQSISRIKKKWKPATINNIPVRYLFRMPFAFQSPN